MFPKQHRALVAALREGGLADPEAEVRRWEDEAVFQEREKRDEADEPDRSDRRTDADDASAWNKWCGDIADQRIELILSPLIEDVGNVCGELRRAIDRLREQVRKLRAQVRALERG